MEKTARKATGRLAGALAVLLAFSVAAVLYYVSFPSRGARSDAAVPAGSSTQSGPSATSSPSASVRAADESGASSGPGQDSPGVTMVASPREDGTWDVVEYVRLRRPSTRLDLSRARIFAAGGEFSDLRAETRELQASAEDDLASVTGSGNGRHVQASSPTRSYVLRYVLDGATVRSVPSKAGRALTALAPIADPGTGADQVRIVVNGSAIRALQCPLLTGDSQLCAEGESPRLSVGPTLTRRTAVALVQFDLPRPQ